MASLSPEPKENFQDLIRTVMPDTGSLNKMLTKFEKELDEAIQLKETYINPTEVPNIRVINYSISELPSSKVQGNHYCISIEPTGIIAASVQLKDVSRSSIQQVFVNYSSIAKSSKKPVNVTYLTDALMTATIFVHTVIAAIKAILHKTEQMDSKQQLPFVLTSYYSLSKHIIRTEFSNLHELIDTQKPTNDPLVKLDIIYLIQVHIKLNHLPVKIVDSISHSVTRLLCAAWECPKQPPSCLVYLHIGEEIHACYFHMNVENFQFTSTMFDVDLANFNGNSIDPSTYCLVYGLPYTEADFQVRHTALRRQFCRDFEKMVSSAHLPELCRLLVLRAFEAKSPKLAWVQNSLTFDQCFEILDDDQSLEKTRKILAAIWECENFSQIKIIRKIVVAIFGRSTALAAMAIAALAKRTGRLQPALGGIRVVLSGSLGGNKIYQGLLYHYINKIFNRDMSKILKFYTCTESATLKGAALHGVGKALKLASKPYTQ